MNDFKENWGEIENRILEQYKEDCAPGGLLDLNGKKGGNELNRANLISIQIRLLTAMGWIDIADNYASKGIELLDISIKKRQTKFIVRTIVSDKLIEYHRCRLEHLFRSILEKKEDNKLSSKIFKILAKEYQCLADGGLSKKKNALIPILCNAAINAEELEFAFKLSQEIIHYLKPKIKSEFDVSVNDWYLINFVLRYLTGAEKDASIKSKIDQYFKLFYENRLCPSLSGFHRPLTGRRPISVLNHTSYVYYKYFVTEIPLNPVLVWQSTIYGFVKHLIRKVYNVSKAT
jgi:hypothetical protein